MDTLKYFEEISAIPRGSGNEKQISDHMVEFAKKLGLEVHQDKAYNIYIKKPASPGYENAPTVVMQGHMDMVCEKNNDTEHDFLTEGIKLITEGDWMRADGTTLGGDDGAAIAMQMAILADDSIKHPALECLMTTDEERGMTGVEALEPEHITGKVLINIDNETEGEFIVSCAGGAKAYLHLPYKEVAADSSKTSYKISIKNLKGGHSGAEIHHQRANAHILMARLLDKLSQSVEYKLATIVGGTKDNVITRECDVVIDIDKADEGKLKALAKEMNDTFKAEYDVQDPDIEIIVESASKAATYIDDDTTKKLINTILVFPNGVMAFDKKMHELVQTSLNLGIVQMSDGEISLAAAVRSSVATAKEYILARLEALSKLIGARFEIKGAYPNWAYNDKSRLRDMAVDVYKEMYGKEPIVTAIHAGLECGFISEKCPGMDMISIGPTIEHIHSPEERMNIPSVKRVSDFVVKLLEKMNEY